MAKPFFRVQLKEADIWCPELERTCKFGAAPAKQLSQHIIVREAGRFLPFSRTLVRVSKAAGSLAAVARVTSVSSLRSSVSPDEKMDATFPHQSCWNKALFELAMYTSLRAIVTEGYQYLNFGPLLPRHSSDLPGIVTLVTCCLI